MATSDKSGKSDNKGPSRPRSTRATSRKKASRPPIIDLEATEVPEEAGVAKTPQASAENQTATAKSEAEQADQPLDQAEAGSADAAKPDEKVETESARDAASGPEADGVEPDVKTGEPSSTGSAEASPVEGSRVMASGEASTGYGLFAIGGSAAAGALLSLAILVGLDRSGVLPWRADNSGTERAQVAAKLDALETRLAGLVEKESATDPALNNRIAGLEKNLGTAGDAVAVLPGLIEKLAARLDGVETSLSDTKAEAQSALSGLKSIETAVDTIGAGEGAASPSIDALELKLSALASRIERAEAQSQTAGDGVEASRIDGLDSSLAEVKAALSNSEARINEITGQVAAIPDSVSPDAFAKELDTVRGAIESRLDAVEKRLGGPGETRSAASAIALASLRRSVDQGTPFAAELAAFSALVPDEPAASVIQPYADSGLMTRSGLAAAFAPVVEESRQSASGKDASQDITGSILSRLQSVVTVRRTGESKGDDAGAVMARMAKSLSQGDLEGAVAQGGAAGDSLPAGPRDWLETARARLAADKALTQADARMLAALAKSGD